MPEVIVARNLPLRFSDGETVGEPISLKVSSPLEVSMLGINLFIPYISDPDRQSYGQYLSLDADEWKTALNLGLQIRTEIQDVRVENFKLKAPPRRAATVNSLWRTDRVVDYASIASNKVIVLDPGESIQIIPHRILGDREHKGPIRGKFDLLAELEE